jgi:hypothetical protein
VLDIVEELRAMYAHQETTNLHIADIVNSLKDIDRGMEHIRIELIRANENREAFIHA